MSAPIAPSEVKDKIPGVNVNFCEKFVKSLGLGKDVYNMVSYFFKEDGTFTDEFIADWCLQANCDATGGGSALLKVDASDGQFTDRIQVTWKTSLSGVQNYDLYRATSDNLNQAARIGADLNTTSYLDTAVTPGTFYYYWVKAKSATAILATSDSDRGFAGTLSSTLAPVTDLAASKGFAPGIGPFISLVWTPVVGAERYDIYRNIVDDFTTANIVPGGNNRTPFDNSELFISGATPTFLDNGGELLYYHDPGSPTLNYSTKFYFWVVAKRDSPSAISQPSNGGVGALGWCVGFEAGDTPLGNTQLSSAATPFTFPASTTRLRFVLFGGGGGGAGGDGAVGGGGGGGGAVIYGELPVVPGGKIRVRSVPEAETSNAATAVNGDSGPVTILEYSANGLFSDTVALATAGAAGGGTYNGVGGTGGLGVKDVSVLNGAIIAGRDGKDTNGIKGGRSGNRFGNSRWPGAHFNGVSFGFSGDGVAKGAGSGSYATPSSAAYAAGGKGYRGFAFYTYRF